MDNDGSTEISENQPEITQENSTHRESQLELPADKKTLTQTDNLYLDPNAPEKYHTITRKVAEYPYIGKVLLVPAISIEHRVNTDAAIPGKPASAETFRVDIHTPEIKADSTTTTFSMGSINNTNQERNYSIQLENGTIVVSSQRFFHGSDEKNITIIQVDPNTNKNASTEITFRNHRPFVRLPNEKDYLDPDKSAQIYETLQPQIDQADTIIHSQPFWKAIDRPQDFPLFTPSELASQTNSTLAKLPLANFVAPKALTFKS